MKPLPTEAAIPGRPKNAAPAQGVARVRRTGGAGGGWRVKRLRFACFVNPSKSELGWLPKSTVVSFLPMDAIGDDGDIRLDQTRTLGEVIQGYTYVRDGDVLLAKITPCFENGKGAVCERLLGGVGFGTTELTVLRPRSGVLSRFLYYLTKSHEFRNLGMASMQGAAGQKRITDDFVLDFRASIPRSDVQTAIADFLDRETAKIDALIAKKQRLIELLEEKRAALISHAVTKGLDPNAPMKDSGIEWLGQIPAHWSTRRLRHIGDSITVGVVVNPSNYVCDEGVPFLLGGDIREFCIDSVDCNRCAPETSDGPLAKSRLTAGDVLVVRVGYPGVAAVVTPDLEGANCASVMIIRNHPRFVPQWLACAFNSKIGRDQIDVVQYGAAQKQFNISHAIDFAFPFPPVEEQSAIASYLDRETARISLVARKATAVIELLRELRVAIISAAVTGKIDVREAV